MLCAKTAHPGRIIVTIESMTREAMIISMLISDYRPKIKKSENVFFFIFSIVGDGLAIVMELIFWSL